VNSKNLKLKSLNQPAKAGFSLVEILMTMVLLGLLTLVLSDLLVKGNSMSSALDVRYQQAVEVQAWILDLQKDLQQGAYISNNSHKYRLEYTTYNTSGIATKKIYGICYATANPSSTDTTCNVSSSTNNIPYLKLSTDGGSTWGSPYRISSYDQYYLSGTPVFLYAQDANNCTSFTDTNGNGVWLSGGDAAGVTASCGSYTTTSPVLDRPNQATKVVLSGFQFVASGNAGTGASKVIRNLPSNIFLAAPQGVVVSSSSAVSPGVKDSPALISLTTNTANSLFGTTFDIRHALWDPSHQRLIVVGHHTSGVGNIFQMERNGVRIGPPLSISNTGVQLIGATLLDNNKTVMALDDSAKKVYWYSLVGGSNLTPMQTFDLSNPSNGSPSLAGSSNLVNSPTGILYDPKYPGEFFVVGTDPADSKMKIFEISASTGAVATTLLSGGKLILPAAFDSSHPPGGLAEEPTTGDFLVVRNYVNGSSPNHTIDIYRITSGGSSSSFSINTDDLGSTATTTTGNWGISYSADSNHLFLTDAASDKIYEVYPPQIISPRS